MEPDKENHGTDESHRRQTVDGFPNFTAGSVGSTRLKRVPGGSRGKFKIADIVPKA
jgi:hypothetical protein